MSVAITNISEICLFTYDIVGDWWRKLLLYDLRFGFGIGLILINTTLAKQFGGKIQNLRWGGRLRGDESVGSYHDVNCTGIMIYLFLRRVESYTLQKKRSYVLLVMVMAVADRRAIMVIIKKFKLV